MHKFFSAVLAAAFLSAGTLATAVADPGHGHGNGNGNAKHETSVHGNSSHEHSTHMASTHSKSMSAHNCVNPAGNKRGWCKGNGTYHGHYGQRATSISGTVTAINGNTVTFMRDNGSTITVLNNNGTALNVGGHYTLVGSMQNGQFVLGSTGNNNYGQSNQTVSGTILSVGNGTITLLGVPPVTINVQQAINNGAINGALSVGRSITAYGYYSNNVFYATAIQ